MIRANRGFTLIEMLGVLTIMAMLSGAASVMLNGSRHQADLQDAIGQIASADSSTRELARNVNQPIQLTISLPGRRLSRTNGFGVVTLGELPGDVKIGRVRTAGQITDSGLATMTFTPAGRSQTYAVSLINAAGEKQWILFSGLSGQMVSVNDEDIDNIFQLASGSPGSDAR